jgi:glycosyltransferase involved in cell wall biosynthesis
LCAVMPTRGFESFSYTALEPMACGCPVIATHCGGPTEIITDGVDGLLVQPGDVEGITAAIQKFIEQPQLRQKLAAEARRTVEKRYAIPAVVPQIVKFYENVITNFRFSHPEQSQAN